MALEFASLGVTAEEKKNVSMASLSALVDLTHIHILIFTLLIHREMFY